jgi:hypothetical protein
VEPGAIRARPKAVAGEIEFLGRRVPLPVGENMVGRVSPYARSVGQGTIVKAIGGKKWTRQLNDDDIRARNALDVEKLDLGPAFGRQLQFRTMGPRDRHVRFEFETERELTRGYEARGRVYVRTGKFQGGAPGTDRVGKLEGGVPGLQP